jgi:hypothetical protein
MRHGGGVGSHSAAASDKRIEKLRSFVLSAHATMHILEYFFVRLRKKLVRATAPRDSTRNETRYCATKCAKRSVVESLRPPLGCRPVPDVSVPSLFAHSSSILTVLLGRAAL